MNNSELTHIINSIEHQDACKIAVIGDVMLDCYFYGSVDRISPESPIPVLHLQSEKNVLGGAGNVVSNLCRLGAEVHCFSMMGHDDAGNKIVKLIDQLNEKARGTAYLNAYDATRTISKTRVIGNGQQQMLRIDREEKESLNERDFGSMIENLTLLLKKGLSVAILSDYGKGFCSDSLCREVIKLCHEYNVPVFIDPKGNDWRRYEGADLITPNLSELALVCGVKIPNESDSEVETHAKHVLEEYQIKSLLVTRSEKGCSFISENTSFVEPSQTREVFDVSGAGDTVISTVAFMHAYGIDIKNSCKIANLACRIVIGHVGTYPVSFTELKKECQSQERISVSSKICTIAEAEALCDSWRDKNEIIVFTNGCFDVFHAGHLDSLLKCRELGDRLVVGLNSDKSVERLKGPTRPVNSEEFRAFVLSGLECVDAVVVFGEDTPEQLLSKIRPNVLAKGGDYKPEQVAGRQYSGRVEILPLVPGLSSTKLIGKMKNGGNSEKS